MFQRIDELAEEPLGYWERNSYMLAITDDDLEEATDKFFDRISSIKGLRIKDSQKLTNEEPGQATLEYEGEEYYIGFYPSDFTLPEAYLRGNYYFSNEEVHALRNANKSFVIFMKFNNDAYKSYHLQLKLLVASINNLIGVMDESAEKILPTTWVKMAAESKILPEATDLYTTQAIYEEGEEVWLHTHGLCRCGLTELEILISSKENYKYHNNLISALASRMLDKEHNFEPMKDPIYVGLLPGGKPILATYLPWTKALSYYDDKVLGGKEYRKDGHNSKTAVIFLYKTEEDIKNGKLTKVNECEELLSEDLMYSFSDEQTQKQRDLAVERFGYVKEYAKDKENTIDIKIKLPKTNDNDDVENIWFNLVEFDGDKFKAVLIQEPFFKRDIKKGDERWFTIDDVVDWMIYTKKCSVIPSTVYVLEKCK